MARLRRTMPPTVNVGQNRNNGERRHIAPGAALVYTGWTAERSTGTYVPAHMENGRFVPGGFK